MTHSVPHWCGNNGSDWLRESGNKDENTLQLKVFFSLKLKHYVSQSIYSSVSL